MRKIIILFTLAVALFACENQDWSFPDYKFTGVYFPYQFPVRTLVLGDDIFDNTNDNNHKFWISATMGGVYDNMKDINLSIMVDGTLCDKAYFDQQKKINLLPSNYYELSSNSNLIIPKGSETGHIEVKLTDAFFADSLSVNMTYVLPIRIRTVENADSILEGRTSIINPDPRIAGNWTVAPKNFTMFAVNYINPYHGHYLLRGVDEVKNASGSTIETIAYHKKYSVQDEVTLLETVSLSKAKYSGPVRKSTGNIGVFKAIITFAENSNCIMSKAEDSAFGITGSGRFVTDGDDWGNEKRDVIYLKYQISNGTEIHNATDTLVIRDRGVVLKQFIPVIK